MPNLNDELETVNQRSGFTNTSLSDTVSRTRFRSAVSKDIAAIIAQLNTVYKPLVSTLSTETGLDALDFGLSGNIIFSDVNASEGSGALYWDTVNSRAKTVKESFDVLLTSINNLSVVSAAAVVMVGATAVDNGVQGLVPAPAAGEEDLFLKGDATWAAVPSASVMTGATAGTDGASGLVPQPLTGQQNLFLRGDGVWAAAAGGSTPGIDTVLAELEALTTARVIEAVGANTLAIGDINSNNNDFLVIFNEGTETLSVTSTVTPLITIGNGSNIAALGVDQLRFNDGSYDLSLKAQTMAEDLTIVFPAELPVSTSQVMQVASIASETVTLEWGTAATGATTYSALTDTDTGSDTAGDLHTWDGADWIRSYGVDWTIGIDTAASGEEARFIHGRAFPTGALGTQLMTSFGGSIAGGNPVGAMSLQDLGGPAARLGLYETHALDGGGNIFADVAFTESGDGFGSYAGFIYAVNGSEEGRVSVLPRAVTVQTFGANGTTTVNTASLSMIMDEAAGTISFDADGEAQLDFDVAAQTASLTSYSASLIVDGSTGRAKVQYAPGSHRVLMQSGYEPLTATQGLFLEVNEADTATGTDSDAYFAILRSSVATTGGTIEIGSRSITSSTITNNSKIVMTGGDSFFRAYDVATNRVAGVDLDAESSTITAELKATGIVGGIDAKAIVRTNSLEIELDEANGTINYDAANHVLGNGSESLEISSVGNLLTLTANSLAMAEFNGASPSMILKTGTGSESRMVMTTTDIALTNNSWLLNIQDDRLFLGTAITGGAADAIAIGHDYAMGSNSGTFIGDGVAVARFTSNSSESRIYFGESASTSLADATLTVDNAIHGGRQFNLKQAYVPPNNSDGSPTGAIAIGVDGSDHNLYFRTTGGWFKVIGTPI